MVYLCGPAASLRFFSGPTKETSMSSTAHIALDLPLELVRELDREETDRGRFIQEAIQHELQRRRQKQILHALHNPHPESADWAELGFDDWAAHLPEEDISEWVDPDAGVEVRWTPGEGWREVKE